MHQYSQGLGVGRTKNEDSMLKLLAWTQASAL